MPDDQSGSYARLCCAQMRCCNRTLRSTSCGVMRRGQIACAHVMDMAEQLHATAPVRAVRGAAR